MIPVDSIGPRRISGVGLIEVLVAVVILSFGMLGIAALQSASLRNSQSALERSQAVVHTYAILDAMRANLAVARIGGYDLNTLTCAAPTAGDLAAADLHDWILALKRDLGEAACAQIKCGSLACRITVQWDDSRGTLGNAEQQLVTETRL